MNFQIKRYWKFNFVSRCCSIQVDQFYEYSQYQASRRSEVLIIDFLFYLLLQAKQRASVKWLLSKAYNNRVPENLREPYYVDNEVRNPDDTRYYYNNCSKKKKKKTRLSTSA